MIYTDGIVECRKAEKLSITFRDGSPEAEVIFKWPLDMGIDGYVHLKTDVETARRMLDRDVQVLVVLTDRQEEGDGR